MALIRYPGSKAKLITAIMRWFPPDVYGRMFNQSVSYEYREPFFGAGAVGFELLKRLPSRCAVWLNDKDTSMAALWRAVAEQPKELCDLINAVEPSAELFYRLKDEDGRTDLPLCSIAVRKLALHRLSYSGLGYMSGGPLGGREQSSEYNVDCRWNPETMRAEVNRLHKLLRQFDDVRITSLDFSELVSDAPTDCFTYMDPPYYEKGPQLYRYSMDQEDHAVLAMLLRKCRSEWVLSYDDHPEVRRLYSWAEIKPIEIRYVMAKAQGLTRPKNHEVVITPKGATRS